MLRIAFFMIFGLTIFTSCEKCKQCSYSYEVTTIVQTVNGEEEVTSEVTGQVLIGPDSTFFNEECIKNDESFTIEEWYIAKGDTTQLDNYEYTCVDF